MPMPTPMPTPAPVAVSALPPSPPPEQPMKRVNGLVFRDLNANGRRDTGEPGLAGIVIEIVTVGPRRAVYEETLRLIRRD